MTGNIFDIIVVIFLILMAVLSLLKGFGKDLISTTSLIAAIVTSHIFGSQIGNFLKLHIHSTYLSYVISGSVIFIATLIASNLILKKLFGPLFKKIPALVDNSFGFLFGFVKGYVILSFMFGIIISISSSDLFYFMKGKNSEQSGRYGPNWLQNSESYEILDIGAKQIEFITKDILSNIVNLQEDREITPEKYLEKSQEKPNKKPSANIDADESGGYDVNELRKMERIINIISDVDQEEEAEDNNAKNNDSNMFSNFKNQLNRMKNIQGVIFGEENSGNSELIDNLIENSNDLNNINNE